MSEYLTEALVLNKEPLGEMDARVVLYSKDFGKIIVKAKSSRKIDSKLNGHLEPLNKVIVRIIDRVDRNGFHVVDALRFGKLSSKLLSILYLLEKIAPLEQADLRLWQIIKSIPDLRDPVNIKILIKKILSVSGFGPDLASCHNCGRKPTRTFIYESANFVCGVCLHHSKISVDEVLSI